MANLDLIGFEGEELTITIVDLTGRTVKTQQLATIIDAEWTQSVDLQGLVSGVYFVKIANKDRVWTQEIIKM